MSKEFLKNLSKEVFIPQGINLSAEKNWPSDDEPIDERKITENIPSTALTPEEALMAKEEDERDAGIRRVWF